MPTPITAVVTDSTHAIQVQARSPAGQVRSGGRKRTFSESCRVVKKNKNLAFNAVVQHDDNYFSLLKD